MSKSGLVWVSGDGRLEDREGHCEMKARDLPDRHQSLNVRFEKGAGRTLQIKLIHCCCLIIFDAQGMFDMITLECGHVFVHSRGCGTPNLIGFPLPSEF